MLTALLAFVLVIGSEASPYAQQGSNSHHQRYDPMEMSNRRALQSNKIVHCDIDDFKDIIGFRDLEMLVEALGDRKGISPYIVLSKLFERMRSTDDMDDAILNTLDGAALQELIRQENNLSPSADNMPPIDNRGPYGLPPRSNNKENLPIYVIPVPQLAQSVSHGRMPPMIKPDMIPRDENDTPLFHVPQNNMHSNRVPPMMMKPEIKPRNEPPFVMNGMQPGEKIAHLLPAVFPLMSSSKMLKPPVGATIHVDSGDVRNPIPDVSITVSPLMTLVEALRQAETKFQNVLGLSHDSDVIVFAHSQAINCFVISRFDDVGKDEDSAWKVTVEDRDGQEVYEDFCLPDAKEVVVKPGTVISLTYVPL